LHVVIVGAGVTGMFTTYYLLKDGHAVTLIDRAALAQTSIFNAGFITPSFAAAPTIGMSTILLACLGRRGPVYISPLEVLRNIRWFRIASKKGLRGYEDVVMSLGRESLALYEDFFKSESVETELVRGVMGIHLSEDDARKAAAISNGRFVDKAEAHQMGFKNVGGGVFFADELCVNPAKLFSELRRKLTELGAEIIIGKEAELELNQDRIVSIRTDRQKIAGDCYVVTAGSWSREICKHTGYDPQILPGRGLTISFETGGERIVDVPAILEDYGIAVTQNCETTLRLTGFFEMVNFKGHFGSSRKRWLLDVAKNHLVGYDKLRYANEGVGYRPCTPDQMPVIGMVPNFRNLYIASGHCRLGLTLAPASGRIIRGMITGTAVAGKLWNYFDPARFVP